MNGHIDEARSNDYVEGMLTEDSTREVEAHLAACEECTAQVERLRSLLADLADLPTEAAPSRDLWAGIQARMEKSEGARRISFSVGQLMAASVALAILSGGSVWMALYGGSGVDSPAAVAVSDVAGADGTRSGNVLPAMQAATTEYEQAIASLESVLERGRGLLDAETLATIQTSLDAIDQAIEEARQALENDPNNDLLNRLLIKNQQSKLRVLRQVSAAVQI
jgi:tetratricopeptide (TPR) repeat protein